MTAAQPDSILTIANRCYRNKDYTKAYILYDYLSKTNPLFGCCEFNKSITKKRLQNKNALVKKNLEVRALQVASILVADNLLTQANECITRHASNLPDSHLVNANIQRNYSLVRWLTDTNKYLKHHGLLGVLFSGNETSSGNILNSLVGEPCRPKEKVTHAYPRVTVMMSCFNAERTIGYALKSLLRQTYENMEIVIVDDCSTDNSLDIVNDLAKQDNRIVLKRNKVNSGTYYSRNVVFQNSSSKYFTILDSDDYALSDRIERQVNILEESPTLVGTLANWLRVTEDGMYVFKNWYGSFLHEAVATLMFRTNEVRAKIGYWDSVRFAADTEYQHRIQKAFGKDSILISNVPAALALYHECSLTRNSQTGISEEHGLSPVRKAYRASWMNWHKVSDICFIDFPQNKRLFDAPLEMI